MQNSAVQGRLCARMRGLRCCIIAWTVVTAGGRLQGESFSSQAQVDVVAADPHAGQTESVEARKAAEAATG